MTGRTRIGKRAYLPLTIRLSARSIIRRSCCETRNSTSVPPTFLRTFAVWFSGDLSRPRRKIYDFPSGSGPFGSAPRFCDPLMHRSVADLRRDHLCLVSFHPLGICIEHVFVAFCARMPSHLGCPRDFAWRRRDRRRNCFLGFARSSSRSVRAFAGGVMSCWSDQDRATGRHRIRRLVDAQYLRRPSRCGSHRLHTEELRDNLAPQSAGTPRFQTSYQAQEAQCDPGLRFQ